MSIGKSLYRSKPCSSIAGVLAIVASLAAMNAEATMVVGDANTKTVITTDSTIITVTNNATLTVTVPGEIEILLVGGGGGAGNKDSNDTDNRGGGGGGGGVIHKQHFNVSTGKYDIVIGAGGSINTAGTADDLANATGGNTTGFNLIAFGGGPGAPAGAKGGSIAGLGASGGGGAVSKSGTTIVGGTAKASSDPDHHGHSGANASIIDNTSSRTNGGGGGGAGGEANKVIGGNGYPCSITGTEVYYGGGGAGGQRYSNLSITAAPGLGGGKANYGGGASAQIGWGSVEATGGPGIVVVKFTRVEQEPSDDFKISGFDAKKDIADGYRYLVITNNTTLQVTGSASCDILLVGGGGGAGANATSEKDSCGGGGGGGGGVIYLQNFQIPAGDYPISVGVGGAVNTGVAATTIRGGDTTAFGLTAFGGGPGAKGDGSGPSISGLGASGGGGATDGGSKTNLCGTVLSAAYNLGNVGSDAPSYGSGYGLSAAYNSGGGGGAGAAANGVHGGDGYACDITGETVYYGGGGAGGQRDYSPADTPAAEAGLGGGKASWGGGGSGGYRYTRNAEAGGHGIVIIRYKKPEKGTVILLK